MKNARTALVALALLATGNAMLHAQRGKVAADDAVDYRIAGTPLPVAPIHQQIAAALKEVSPDQIKANISHLVDSTLR